MEFLPLPPAATPGQALEQIDTPALLLDLDAFERNLDFMQDNVRRAGLQLRPHAKAHKCPQIALAQLARGAAGICCQKISEAVPFMQAGVRNIHISNEVGSPQKARLLAGLALHADISVCVDDATQVEWLEEALRQADASLVVLVEADIGQGRCGVPDAASCLRLIDMIARQSRMRFGGLQAYHGGVQHLRGHGERRDAVLRANERTSGFLRAMDVAGIRCPVVTGGGTGSVEFDLESGVYTELQPGSYVFMDGDYGRNEWTGGLRFEQSLFVASAVMSRIREGRVVLDAGLKSLAVDSGLPHVHGRKELEYISANDEHGIVTVSDDERQPELGELVLLVPGHCDPTLNLHEELIGFRGRTVECVWPVAARGLSR
ncbi:DSD1 family PLP-dependent enzyme [Noviherbaspirillum aerium]|uniref:DSD1 family PLP-dependent enzyme n=1 Tax=Noviherbaspirillum aerium TaxID=2588497 RepID=UPI00124E84FE|nr:DSD1 family PLP-dependent enzyme [Noviherbaspirillum aerium]